MKEQYETDDNGLVITPMTGVRNRDRRKENRTRNREIPLEKLVPFNKHPFKLYAGQRFTDMVESIKAIGVQQPIVVRPIENGEKFEILVGHNRAEAARAAGLETISCIVRENFTDDEALRIVVESNLNQQSFAEWSYSQQIRLIKIHGRFIKEHSQRGRRSDLLDIDNDDSSVADSTCVHSEHKLKDKPNRPTTKRNDLLDGDNENSSIRSIDDATYVHCEHKLQGKPNRPTIQGSNLQDGDNKNSSIRSIDGATYVHCEHKLQSKPNRPTTRDKIARGLGLSPTTFERYKSIAKLEDDDLAAVGEMLDDKRLSFMSAFHLSKLKPGEITTAVKVLKNNLASIMRAEIKIKVSDFKQLYNLSRESENDLTVNKMTAILFPCEIK